MWMFYHHLYMYFHAAFWLVRSYILLYHQVCHQRHQVEPHQLMVPGFTCQCGNAEDKCCAEKVICNHYQHLEPIVRFIFFRCQVLFVFIHDYLYHPFRNRNSIHHRILLCCHSCKACRHKRILWKCCIVFLSKVRGNP